MKNYLITFTLVTGEKRSVEIQTHLEITNYDELHIHLLSIEEGEYFGVYNGLISKKHVVAIDYKGER
ncbi:hypothetical protein [Peribacillus huizhouensis]|uniref:Uncharacterized protein n=1 Tax=Peribacillus huizhouensis TaxID=1501239 RepID=A0ABR6CRB1_9BACI|nr:hypothetical protein [Peribacillus huizhouensis]MBA9027565.1 hypothetical protein [Peribacillus huizhouensis]